MSIHHWLVYLFVIFVLIIMPGPSSILSMTQGAKYGARRAVASIFGGVSAALTLMLLSACGVGAILAASTTIFTAVKFLGAAYLLWLGVQAWRAAPLQLQVPEAQEAEEKSISQLFAHGYFVGVGNPKDLLFFSALFPQFVNTAESVMPQLTILAITWAVVDFLAMFFYAVAGKKVAYLITRKAGGKLFNRLTGSFFIAAGGVLAAASK